MRRKCTALLTLLIFAASVFLPSAASLAEPAASTTAATATTTTTTAADPAASTTAATATTSTPAAATTPATTTTTPATTYTAYDNTPNLKDATGIVEGMKELRVKNGSDAGVLVYALNMSREMPTAAGTSGYTKLSATTNQDWAARVDKAASPSTLRQDVLNVIWNGYPYFAGSWKGVDRDFAAIGQNSGLSGAVVEQLNNIAVTQQAIWALTDSRPGAGNTQSYVNALIAASQKNPAPANFGLDLYDGSAAKSTKAGKKMTNLVAVSAAQQKPASIKLSHRWLDENGQPLTGVKTPSLSFALYPENAAADAQPLATYALNEATGNVAFTLFDDEQSYRVVPVLTGETEGFTVGQAQTFSLKGDQGAVIHLDFVTTYKNETPAHDPQPASVPLGADVSLGGKAPKDGVFTLLLKDEAGNILQSKTNVGGVVNFDALTFDKEGSHNYTISMQAGSDSAIAYDKTVYKVKIDVSRGEDYTATVTYEKDGVIYTGLPAFAAQNVTTPSTTTPTKTVSVTVNKVWKNDKSSSRPSSVKMQLYRDGKSYGSSVTLNSDNGWKYTWSNLDASYKWTVNEPSVPSGYSKKVSNSGNSWTVTNTAKSSSSPKVTTPTIKSGTKTKTSDNDNDKSSKDRSTPETGDNSNVHLLGTVAIISLSGMVVIAAVWLLSRRRLH